MFPSRLGREMETMVFDAEAKRHLIVGAGRGSAGVDV